MRLKICIVFVTLSLIFLSLTGCQSSIENKEIEDKGYNYLNEPFIFGEEKVELNIKDKDKVIEILGTPLSEDTGSNDTRGTYFVFNYEGLHFSYVQNDKGDFILDGFHIASDKIMTYRHVSIGQSFEDISNKYGEPDTDGFNYEGNRVISYPPKEGSSLWFELKDNKIIRIVLINHEKPWLKN